MEQENRWLAFTNEEVRTIYVEMTTDDSVAYGFSEGDEPAYTLTKELEAELERRGISVGRA